MELRSILALCHASSQPEPAIPLICRSPSRKHPSDPGLRGPEAECCRATDGAGSGPHLTRRAQVVTPHTSPAAKGSCCMIVPRIVSLVAALVLTAQADLFAQQEPPVAPGDRVRVLAPTIVAGERLVGTIVSMGPDTCVLEIEGRSDPTALPVAPVTRLEVSRGQKSHTLLGPWSSRAVLITCLSEWCATGCGIAGGSLDIGAESLTLGVLSGLSFVISYIASDGKV